MGASASITKEYTSEEIYNFIFKYSFSLSELEYLYCRYKALLEEEKESKDVLFLRARNVLFPSVESPGLINTTKFETFLSVVSQYRSTGINERIDLLFKIFDVDEDGQINGTDLVLLLPSPTLKKGDRVRILSDNRLGVLRYLDGIKGRDGMYAGIELDEPVGKNNGMANGVQYFKCDENKGIFIDPSRIASEKSFLNARSLIQKFTKEADSVSISQEVFKSRLSKELFLTDLLSKEPLPEELTRVIA